jgi:hypothetical protein
MGSRDAEAVFKSCPENLDEDPHCLLVHPSLEHGLTIPSRRSCATGQYAARAVMESNAIMVTALSRTYSALALWFSRPEVCVFALDSESYL